MFFKTAFKLARPFVFCLDAEKAHQLTIASLKMLPPAPPQKRDDVLTSSVAGIEFPNPVGLAAGFDKNGEVPYHMLGMGFGFAELGTVTPQPQDGNPKPRIFRLTEDKAVINRLGFNNEGQQAVIHRMQSVSTLPGVVGINIGANKDSVDRIDDYAQGVRNMLPFARYLTVNISSPNTVGLRALQDKAALTELIDAVMRARGESNCPVFLKVAPDLEPADIEDISAIAAESKLDALIVSNTTISRPELKSRHANETGGLSGAPLHDLALQRIRDFRKATSGNIPLIAVGGISSGEQAYARIRAGASLVQLYSAMVYEGPLLAKTIAKDLKRRLIADGFANVNEAIGVDKN